MNEYGFNHQGRTYFPSGGNVIAESPESTDIRNRELARRELEEFKTNPPTHLFCYIHESTQNATTWTGEVLGSVVFGREYKTPAFGGWPSKRVPVTIHAINGKRYVGTYYKSSGDYARVRLAKNQ